VLITTPRNIPKHSVACVCLSCVCLALSHVQCRASSLDRRTRPTHESHAANGSGRHTAPVRAPAAVCSLRDIPAVSRQPAGPAQVCSDKSFISRQEEFTRLIEWNLSQTGAQACRVNRVRDSDAHPMQEAHKGAGDMPAMRPAKGDNAFLERVQERKEQVVLILSYTRTHARTYTYLASPATNMP
jgi:hypothetical protein